MGRPDGARWWYPEGAHAQYTESIKHKTLDDLKGH